MTKRKGQRAEGYAVLVDGSIDVKTASPTRIGAIVNWLVVERDIVMRRTDSDAAIEALWLALKDDAEVTEVWIDMRRKEGNGDE